MSVCSNDGWCSCCWWRVSIFNCCSRFEKSTYVLNLTDVDDSGFSHSFNSLSFLRAFICLGVFGTSIVW